MKHIRGKVEEDFIISVLLMFTFWIDKVIFTDEKLCVFFSLLFTVCKKIVRRIYRPIFNQLSILIRNVIYYLRLSIKPDELK